ncbi:MAG: nucleoside kinase [Firmicutes bacterium]|nr:nucleoside kinase [Bacillota bacterium]
MSIRLMYQGNPWDVEEGSTFLSLAKEVQASYDAPIILAKVGQKLVELNKPVTREGVLTFLTTKDPDGHKTYQRGATMMFLRAMGHVLKEKLLSLKLEYSIGDGLYFIADVEGGLTDEMVAEAEKTMRGYVEEDLKFEKSKISTDEARDLFHAYGMKDKEQLFRFRRSSTANVYRLGNYVDYYYGYMPPSTGMVRRFKLKRYEGGVLMVLPKRSEPEKDGSEYVAKKLFFTMEQTNVWGAGIGVPTVGALNEAICRGEGRDIILASEAYQEHKIGEIARQIREEGRRIVMIAGPSSSGKTSFSHRLSVQLGNVGLKSYPVAIDNYFVEREKCPRDENGDYDFECLEALDVELFNDQMTSLLRGEKVSMPTFNFVTGKPEFKGNHLAIKNDAVLVLEGIHGLNEALTYQIAPEDKYKIYISAVTALNVDEHNRIPTTDNREIRRMVRDARTRGTSARETIARWNSVRRGEERHIFPFQEQADVMFNSASLYELAVLKTFAEPLLFSIPMDAPEYPEAKRLLKFLDYFLGLSCEDVPRNSLVREFIGGSIFPVG